MVEHVPQGRPDGDDYRAAVDAAGVVEIPDSAEPPTDPAGDPAGEDSGTAHR